MMFLMSSSDKGYRMRLGWALSAIHSVFDERAWKEGSKDDEVEDARTLVSIFRKVVKGR